MTAIKHGVAIWSERDYISGSTNIEMSLKIPPSEGTSCACQVHRYQKAKRQIREARSIIEQKLLLQFNDTTFGFHSTAFEDTPKDHCQKSVPRPPAHGSEHYYEIITILPFCCPEFDLDVKPWGVGAGKAKKHGPGDKGDEGLLEAREGMPDNLGGGAYLPG